MSASKDKPRKEPEPKVYKVILLGSSGAGKSCIIHRFVNNTFAGNEITGVGFPSS